MIDPSAELWPSQLILNVQRKSVSFKSSFGGFGGHWGFLIGVWHLDLDLDIVRGPGFGFNFCSVESRKYVVSGGFGFGVRGSGSAEVKD